MFTASRPKGWPDLHGNIHDLVGGLEHEFYDFPYIGNFIIPTDFPSIIFQRGRLTTNQMMLMVSYAFGVLEMGGKNHGFPYRNGLMIWMICTRGPIFGHLHIFSYVAL